MNLSIRTVCLLLTGLLLSGCSSTPEEVDYHQSSMHWSSRLAQDSAYLQDSLVAGCTHLAPLLAGTWVGRGDDLASYLQWISAGGSRAECVQKATPEFFRQLQEEGYSWSREDHALISAVLQDDRETLGSLMDTVAGVRAYDHALIQRLQTDFYRHRVTLERARQQSYVVEQHIRRLAEIRDSLLQRLELWRSVSVSGASSSPLPSGQVLDGYAQNITRLDNLRQEIDSLYAGAFFQ